MSMQCPTCGKSNAAGATICSACGSKLGQMAPATGGTVPFSPSLASNTRLQNGAFSVGTVLGQGGFGITYKGGDMQLRRYVAIKEFFPNGCARSGQTVQPAGGMSQTDYQSVKAKFLEEARTLARFNHPGIVRVFATFEENNTAYTVMEYLEGKTLQQLLEEKGTLPETMAVGYIEKVGDALTAVHAANLIHRDLKPDNIIVTNDGRVVLIDFGTARAFAAGKTVQQTALLTPGYAPLEQYGSQARFGTYSDIYSLGATLYHCLTGRQPPQATDRITGVDLQPPHELNSTISITISQAVVWAMQLKADQRPQTIHEFLNALKAPSASQPVAPVPSSTWPAEPASVPAPVIPQQAPAVPQQAAYPTALWIQHPGNGQLLTNADAWQAFNALVQAFQSQGVNNVTGDRNTMQVHGHTGVSATSYGQQVMGQVIPGHQGNTVTVQSKAVAGVTDFGRGRSEAQAIINGVEANLRANPQATVSTGPPAANPYEATYPTSGYAPPGYSSPGYAPAGYSPSGYPAGGYPSANYTVGGKGSAVLTYGILGILCCGIFAPIAWVTGNNALQAYGEADPGDRGSVVAGRIMGIVGTVLWVAWLLFVFIGAMSGSS